VTLETNLTILINFQAFRLQTSSTTTSTRPTWLRTGRTRATCTKEALCSRAGRCAGLCSTRSSISSVITTPWRTPPARDSLVRYFVSLFLDEMLIYLLADLAEVTNVVPAPPAAVPPKKTDDKSFFDVSSELLLFNFF